MDHRPYENWLLDDERLTAGQERELRLHLRNCPECTALSRSNMVLRAAPMSTPPPGFTLRFQTRLAAERKVQRWRNLMGWTLLLAIGMGVVLLVATPYLAYYSSPAKLAGAWMSDLVYIGSTLHIARLVGATLLDVLGSFVPGYVWGLSFVAFSGAGVLWVSSFRKFGRVPQVPGQFEANR